MISYYKTLTVTVFSLLLATASFVLAAGEVPYPDTFFGTQISSPQGVGEVLARVIAFFGSAIFAISVFVFLYAGFLYVTAGDNEDNISKAKSFITYGIVGIAVALIAWSIPPLVVFMLGGGSTTTPFN